MANLSLSAVFFFNNTPPTEIYTLSLHDALPIYKRSQASSVPPVLIMVRMLVADDFTELLRAVIHTGDRKSTRLNSSHVKISYAVFCLKKKKTDSAAEKRLPA